MITAGEDRIEGAEAVAAELGWKVSRVYHVMGLPKERRRDAPPMWKEPLAGIVSTRSAIADYHRRRAAEAIGCEPGAESDGVRPRRPPE